MDRQGSRQNQQRSRSRSPIHTGIRAEPGIHNGSSIYTDDLNFRYYTHNVTANKRQLRCVNYYSMRCRGRGSVNLDNTDFRMTRPHYCVPLQSVNNDENDNRTSLLITLRQRATREQTYLQTIYNEEIQRFPSSAQLVTYVQASRSMQRARRGHQPHTPDVEEVIAPVPIVSPIRANNEPAENLPSARNGDVPGRIRREIWGQFFQSMEGENDVEEVIAPVPRVSPIRANNEPAENLPSARNGDVPGRIRREIWGQFFQSMEGENDVEEVIAPVPRVSPIRANNEPAENLPRARNGDVPGRIRREIWGQFFQSMEGENDVEEVIAPVPRVSPIRANNEPAENLPSGRNGDVPGRIRREIWGQFFQRMEGGNDVEEVTASVPRVSPIRANNEPAEIVEICIICFNDETNVTLRPCNHKFCNTCTIRLMEDDFNTCPLCRGSIVAYDDIQL
ncbi:uncharacterized protein LOC100569305 [Acyrthosiphon pisum]|uniref:RING-type domain-containing protein n=1 Tax=Acyrthosiphon pisum TaxID=7029 RepID=A0A8R2JL40_ACYPI|nr:uncharacterized protein LOC100569305 [Acyrthosiphon pisum]|eukprot:XP_016660871.1 PREDICTED: uncharacterized protein LOC100569305 [Acyrthosiphon pisum]